MYAEKVFHFFFAAAAAAAATFTVCVRNFMD